ncbi:MAG: ABC transporter permease [Bdellovibrionota bacterium]
MSTSAVEQRGSAVLSLLDTLGGFLLDRIEDIGRYFRLVGHAFRSVLFRPLRVKEIMQQMEFVGVQSTGIIALTGIFTGMVFALQTGHAFRQFGAESLVGGTSVLALVRELGPVLAALMVTGRAGSAMASELATMRVTEQIDALHVMAARPIQLLILPRILAGLVMVPALTVVFDFVGALGSYFVSLSVLQIAPGSWWKNVIEFVGMDDVNKGLVKALVFGFILSSVGCYKGFFASGGARGVGRATTESVVYSSVLILVSDYFLTSYQINFAALE